MVGWHSGLNSNVLDNWTYCIFFIHFSIKLIFSSDLSFYIPVLMLGPIPRGSILINNDFLSSYRRSRLSQLFLTVKTIIIYLTKMILIYTLYVTCTVYDILVDIFRFMLILEYSRYLNSRKFLLRYLFLTGVVHCIHSRKTLEHI